MSQAEWGRTGKMIEIATRILEDSYPQTVRQIYYRFVSLSEEEKDTIGGFPNNRLSLEKISRLLRIAMESDRIPWEWIVDKSRPTYHGRGGYTRGPGEYLREVLLSSNDYFRDYTVTQPNFIQVWLEKDALSDTIVATTRPLGVDLVCARGFSSCSKSKEIAEELETVIDKPITIFYLGDHDPSGHCIEQAMARKVREYSDDVDFTIKRLAIHKADIARFHLPPQKIKSEDSRAEGFREKFGEQCVELDALPVEELRRRVHDAIWELIDEKEWNRAIEQESREGRVVERYMTKFRSLLPKKVS